MYININGQNIYYQKIGRGKNLVLLHGWANDVSTWWGVVDGLKGDFTLWLIDLPGFGRSDIPKKAIGVKDYADTVYEFIKNQKINQPIILGHSHGGRTAIKLAASHPEAISKLILEDAAGIKPKRDGWASFFYVLAKASHLLLPNIFRIKDRIRFQFYKKLESDYYWAGGMKQTLINVINEDLTEDIKTIKSDTLLIWGEKDKNAESSLAVGRKMYQMIKCSRLEVIENVGHFPHLENPEKFVYFVKDFAS